MVWPVRLIVFFSHLFWTVGLGIPSHVWYCSKSTWCFIVRCHVSCASIWYIRAHTSILVYLLGQSYRFCQNFYNTSALSKDSPKTWWVFTSRCKSTYTSTSITRWRTGACRKFRLIEHEHWARCVNVLLPSYTSCFCTVNSCALVQSYLGSHVAVIFTYVCGVFYPFLKSVFIPRNDEPKDRNKSGKG